MKNYFSAALKRMFGNGKNTDFQVEIATSAEPVKHVPEQEVEAEEAIVLTIWTIERTRYVAPRALCTDIEVFASAAVVLCEDIHGYVFDTPNGECVVVETGTGSLVGQSLEAVKDGIREMTHVQLKNQLETGKKEFNRMKKQELSNDEFWQAIKMGGAEIEIAQDYQE